MLPDSGNPDAALIQTHEIQAMFVSTHAKDGPLEPLLQQKDAGAYLCWLQLVMHDMCGFTRGFIVWGLLYKTACYSMKITVAVLQVMDSCRELFRGIEWVYDYDPPSTVYYAKREAMRVLLQCESWTVQSELGLFYV